MATCLEYGEERVRECDDFEDQGYNSCSSWNPWFAWICIATTWVSHVVCVGYRWVTTVVCILYDVVTTVYNAIFVTLESIFGWILSLTAFLIELLEMIPFLGTIIRWVLNGLSYVIFILLSLVDAGMGFLGVRPEKILRVCTVILKDEDGNDMASVEDVVFMLQLAADVYKRDANIRIVPLRPFKYSTGFSGAETVDKSWVQIDGGNSDADILDSPCNEGGALSEWGLAGTKFQFKVSTFCLFGSWRRVLGYGAPITIFINRSTPPNDSGGCGLGIVDFVTISENAMPSGNTPSPRAIGHEAGHACSLWHVCVDGEDGVNNIMAAGTACDPDSLTPPDRDNPVFRDWQVLIVRSSKHVTYF